MQKNHRMEVHRERQKQIRDREQAIILQDKQFRERNRGHRIEQRNKKKQANNAVKMEREKKIKQVHDSDKNFKKFNQNARTVQVKFRGAKSSQYYLDYEEDYYDEDYYDEDYYDEEYYEEEVKPYDQPVCMANIPAKSAEQKGLTESQMA